MISCAQRGGATPGQVGSQWEPRTLRSSSATSEELQLRSRFPRNPCGLTSSSRNRDSNQRGLDRKWVSAGVSCHAGYTPLSDQGGLHQGAEREGREHLICGAAHTCRDRRVDASRGSNRQPPSPSNCSRWEWYFLPSGEGEEGEEKKKAGQSGRSVRVWQLGFISEPCCPLQAGRTTAAVAVLGRKTSVEHEK